jgi:malate dehydrogenase
VRGRRHKITIVGAGATGATTAHWCAARELGDIVLFDVVEGLPQGKALDLWEATPLVGVDVRVTGTTRWEDTAGSDVVVVTAGSPRKPGMSRRDLLAVNVEVVAEVARRAVERSPDAVFVVLTNPVDVMAYVVLRVTGLPPARVVGQAGVLDSTRFRAFVAAELGVSVRDVTALVIGGHGDSMVPLVRLAQVGGVPLTALLPPDAIARLVERTRRGGAEIVELLRTGSAFYAPGAALTEMLAAILYDHGRLLPAPAYLQGEYGLHGLYTGVPVILDGSGVRRVVEVPLEPEERAAFLRSAEEVRAAMAELPESVRPR